MLSMGFMLCMRSYFTVKHTWYYKCVGRVVFFCFGEAFMVACYSFFLFKRDFLTSYKLDFILPAVVLLMGLDLLYC
jgi:hypothetical protein